MTDLCDVSRRTLFKGVGATAVAAAAAGTIPSVLQPAGASAAVISGALDGPVHDQGGQVFNVKNPAYGAKGDIVFGSAGSIAAGSTTFTSQSGTFASTDVGKLLTVQGAGASAQVFLSTITAVVTATVVTLADAASTTASGAAYAYGTDDTKAIAAAVAAA